MNKFDVIVNAGGGIFPSAFIACAGAPILNAHMGYLPFFRGMNVLEWGIFEGIPPIVTIHRIVAGIDMGPIYLHVPIAENSSRNLPALRGATLIANVTGIARVIGQMRTGPIEGETQNPSKGRQYYVMHPELRARAENLVAVTDLANLPMPALIELPTNGRALR